jgi:starch phosphorylase
LAPELQSLFDEHVPGWRKAFLDPEFWQRLDAIPRDALLATKAKLRRELVSELRRRTGVAYLDDDRLTLGFARRFATYKRATLLFQDPARLERILDRGVQLVFAGKAHPADEAGKHHLQNIFKRALDPRLAGRIAFVDDYDLHVAHLLVQGCDIWLNTPRKPLEASGTSGMKASMNGTLHLSIGDGWWAEGCTGSNGWVISGKPESQDTDAVDTADANALYTLLEDEIVPSYYERDARGIPRRWIAMVKQAILTVTPRFSARRMLKEYAETAYLPAFTKRTGSPTEARSAKVGRSEGV